MADDKNIRLTDKVERGIGTDLAAAAVAGAAGGAAGAAVNQVVEALRKPKPDSQPKKTD
jgi:hypothetical protein